MVAVSLKHTLIALCIVLTTVLAVPAQRNPIRKDNLFRALRMRALSANEFSDLIRKHRVDFKLTGDDERQIRRAGKYLGKKGLDKIIGAIRDSYIFSAGIVDPSKTPDTNKHTYQGVPFSSPTDPRTASNSRNVSTRPNFLIEIFNIKASVAVKREGNSEIQGLHDTSASLSFGEQNFKMVADSNISVDSTNPDRLVASVRYLFDSPNPLFGKPIFFLSMVKTVTIDHSKIFQKEKLATTNNTTAFELSVIINTKEYRLETPTVTDELLASGEVSFNVQEALKSVIDDWIKTNIVKVSISSITPNRLSRSPGVLMPLTIRGEGFQQGLMLFLLCKNGPAQAISPGQIVKFSPNEVIVMFNNYSGFVGACQLSIQNRDGGRSNAVDLILTP